MPPVNNRKPIPQRPDGVLGEWRDGAFHFDSPDAERQWAVDAYRNGVHAGKWHLGTVLDDKTRDVVLSGLGGATAPVYRSPDGSYRFANSNTVEPADMRTLRQKSFQGVKLQDLKGPVMPGEDVIAARFDAGRAANDNAAPAANNNTADDSPANDNAAPVAPLPTRGIGRFAAMAEAQKNAIHLSPQEILQALDDGVRLFANGATIGYADNAAAAADAFFGDRSFAEDYERNLTEQKARTAAARTRTGKVGAFIEAAPGAIPGYGDALTIIGDTKQYIEHPETATIGNILGTAVTALPMTPNLLGTARKVENAAEDAARLEVKTAEKIDDLPGQTKIDDPAPTQPVAPKPEPIRIDVNDPASVDAYFKRPLKDNEGPRGHVISQHVGKTDQELMQRIQADRHVIRSSSFPDEATAERVIHDGLRQNRQKVIDWLKDPNGREILSIRYSGSEVIGRTVSKKGGTIQQNSATVVLLRDKTGGFHYHTAYPGN